MIDIDGAIASMDADTNGVISLREFLKYLSQFKEWKSVLSFLSPPTTPRTRRGGGGGGGGVAVEEGRFVPRC
jgi:hypothetical protein